MCFIVFRSGTKYVPQLPDDGDPKSHLGTVKQIIEFLASGKRLTTWVLLWHPEWKRFIESARVGDEIQPNRLEHFHALQAKLSLLNARATLVLRWQQHLVPHGLPSLETVPDPLQFAAQHVARIKTCLDWHTGHWQPMEIELQAQGLAWSRLLEEAPPSTSVHHRAERLRHTVLQLLPRVIAAESARRRQAQLMEVFAAYEKALNPFATVKTVGLLTAAVKMRSGPAYRQHHGRIEFLLSLQPAYRERQARLGKIRAVAPAWADAIQDRRPPHDQAIPPGDPTSAWRWRQFSEELDRRAALSVPELQDKIERLGKELMEVTTLLVERRAWAALIRRIANDDPARQALLGWVKATKKLGAGTGKNAEALKRQANKLMNDARRAVPVWVMPFSRVTENFHPVRDHFDVLIVDEASQEDVVGLAPFYMADKIIVVGDDEQVTPLDVGGEQQPIQDLIGQWLTDLPSPQLFDLKTSIYDRAQIAFGSTIRLKEHFRCVPEIIQFSNHLSYGGEIRPLRESASTPIKPALVAHRVEGIKIGKENAEEAETITALIAAAIELPEYAGKTFGVVSLLGTEQADKIERLLRTRLDAVEYEQRRILCGNPAQFQGDERDVMLLSVVDSKTEGDGPLGMKGDGADGLWKKRYNVAASRAKDQLWVVYSLDHLTQLKPGDLRRRLVEHALDPGALMRLAEEATARTESPFEAEVYKRLVSKGYQVTPQWRVGAYRIDLVVEGVDGKRLAVECDGDRWHYDKVSEDMARQALLERLGWHFVRIRGTTFYRNRDQAMQPLYQRLGEMGIVPVATADIEPDQVAPDPLLERVTRRAAELRTLWATANNE
jgi:very-short-patch-repair endonuclease